MKLAHRISSIRRIAWNACRSCSADSLSMWCDSLASSALAGWMRSPSASSTRGHRVLGEPVDLEPGNELAQLFGDRDVAARMAEADRRADIEGPPRANLRPRPPPGLRLRRRRPVDELAQGSVDLRRVARLRAVAGPLERHQGPAGELGQGRPLRMGHDRVPIAVDHERRAADPLGKLADALAADGGQRDVGLGERRRIGLEGPADAVLDLLGRVRLAEHLAEEEPEEVLVLRRAATPVVVVVLGPALVGLERLVEGRGDRALRVAGRERNRGPDDRPRRRRAPGARRRARLPRAPRRRARRSRRARCRCGPSRRARRGRTRYPCSALPRAGGPSARCRARRR